MRNLHIILLESDNVLAHVSEKTVESEIFQECVCLYDFAKQYAPKTLIDIIVIHSLFEIDFHVKKYMQSYGINHVRGGTYIEPILTPNQYNTLESEFEIHSIIHKHDMVLAHDACSQTSIIQKMALLDSLKYAHVHNTKYEISRETIQLIEWLQSTIEFSKTYAEYFKRHGGQAHMRYEPDAHKKYAYIIAVFKELYAKVKLVRDSIECDYPPYLENPQFVFDNFVYHISTPYAIIENYDAAMYMCGRFEYMCYILINRIDELEFDIKNP